MDRASASRPDTECGGSSQRRAPAARSLRSGLSVRAQRARSEIPPRAPQIPAAETIAGAACRRRFQEPLRRADGPDPIVRGARLIGGLPSGADVQYDNVPCADTASASSSEGPSLQVPAGVRAATPQPRTLLLNVPDA